MVSQVKLWSDCESMQTLVDRLARAFSRRSAAQQAQAAAVGLFCGLETRSDPAKYWWDGRKRSTASRPFVLLQYTLAGEGRYRDTAGLQTLGPGRAFLAVIPSAHVYYLPTGHTWQFFWNILHHPYAVQRLATAVGGVGRTMTLAPASPLVLAAAELFEGACRGGFDDQFDRESATFRLMLEAERHLHERTISATERDRLLSDVRRYVIEHLDRRVDVEELAGRSEMSRSHFSHHFKDVTGRSPGEYITEVRLSEAARLLSTGDLPLKLIAGRCGFADANHLCKSFRRRYRISPGMYRRQG
jgi:AraC-like DNA-binding protein